MKYRYRCNNCGEYFIGDSFPSKCPVCNIPNRNGIISRIGKSNISQKKGTDDNVSGCSVVVAVIIFVLLFWFGFGSDFKAKLNPCEYSSYYTESEHNYSKSLRYFIEKDGHYNHGVKEWKNIKYDYGNGYYPGKSLITYDRTYTVYVYEHKDGTVNVLLPFMGYDDAIAYISDNDLWSEVPLFTKAYKNSGSMYFSDMSFKGYNNSQKNFLALTVDVNSKCSSGKYEDYITEYASKLINLGIKIHNELVEYK